MPSHEGEHQQARKCVHRDDESYDDGEFRASEKPFAEQASCRAVARLKHHFLHDQIDMTYFHMRLLWNVEDRLGSRIGRRIVAASSSVAISLVLKCRAHVGP